jgi:hypothetical protein
MRDLILKEAVGKTESGGTESLASAVTSRQRQMNSVHRFHQCQPLAAPMTNAGDDHLGDGAIRGPF